MLYLCTLMLEDFIIGRIRAELPFEPNEEKEGLFRALGAFIVSRDPRKAFILRGYAGTGKTSVMSALVRALSALKQPCVLLAPTGRAAKVLSRYSGAPAFTIHKKIYRQNQLGQESFSLTDNLHRNTLFIVDEASMISGSRESGGSTPGHPFGAFTFGSGCLLDDLVRFVYSGSGCSLLLLGDDAQLPPVGSLNSPALDAGYMKGYGLSVTEYGLTQVARQALDSGVLSEATRIREMIGDWAVANSDLSIQPNGADIVPLKGEEVIEMLERSWREVGAEETLLIARSNKMTNLYNQGVRARVLWKEEELSNGDRVMVSKNNYLWTEEDEQIPFIANGDMFEIRRLHHHHEMYGFHFANATLHSFDYDRDIEAMIWLETLTTDNPEANYTLQRELFSRIAEDYPEIRNKKELVKQIFASPYYNALQIRFAYCVTCHKAQGGQWKHVYINSGMTEEWLEGLSESEKLEYMRWLYTAVTRSTEKIYLLR